jgi:hypothetical protein
LLARPFYREFPCLITHNEVPYDSFLAEELKNKTITTPLQAIQEIVNIATAIYEKLVIEVGNSII